MGYNCTISLWVSDKEKTVPVKLFDWDITFCMMHPHFRDLKIFFNKGVFSSVQFIRSVVSSSLQPHGLQHARPPCPSPTPGTCSNSCPLSQWCHPTICRPLLLLPSIFPSIKSFPRSQFFTSGGQSIEFSASASVLPVNIQDWFPLGLTRLISLLSRNSQESSPTPQFKNINSLALSFLYSPTLTSIPDYWKNHSFD